jgi:hypothetical protein
LESIFPGVTACKSEALIMKDTGPRADPIYYSQYI